MAVCDGAAAGVDRARRANTDSRQLVRATPAEAHDFSSASASASDMARATADAAVLRGRPARPPSTPSDSSTTTAWIFVPPRSIPPRLPHPLKRSIQAAPCGSAYGTTLTVAERRRASGGLCRRPVARVAGAGGHIGLAGGATPRGPTSCWRDATRSTGRGRPLVWRRALRSAGRSRVQLPDGRRDAAARLRAPPASTGSAARTDPDAAAADYAAEIPGVTGSTWRLLGLGEDAHTASLFPAIRRAGRAQPAGGAGDRVKPPPRRITLTLPVLRGGPLGGRPGRRQGKAAAVAAVSAGRDRPSGKPASGRPGRGLWSTARRAARKSASD